MSLQFEIESWTKKKKKKKIPVKHARALYSDPKENGFLKHCVEKNENLIISSFNCFGKLCQTFERTLFFCFTLG